MSQNVNVNLVPGSYPKEFHVSQYDVGRQLVANIVDSTGAYSIPSGATVTLVGTKPSGFGFTLSGSVGSGGVVTFSTTATVTAEYGRIPCEIRITSGDTVLGTANLMLIVEESPHQEGVIDGNSETVIPELTILVERVEAAASNVLDMQVEADTLPAGSSATYSYNEETNTATFGIPQGEAGAGAAGVVASAYSASSTYAVGDYVIHDGNLYRCTTAITTAEAFTAAHWTQVVLGDDVSDLKSDLNKLIVTTEETSEWTFSTTTNSSILKTIRFSASVCEISGRLKSVNIKMRNEDSGSVSLCLAEVVGTTATVYAVIPITLHANPATNMEYVNGVDFTYSSDVRANTIFGVWSDSSKQINYGTETVKSYGISTQTPLNYQFSTASPNNYNVAVAFDVVKTEPAVTTEEVDEIKDELSVLVTDETIQSSWSFSTSTNAGILNTVRFSASICAEESNLESVSIKTRNEDSGSVSICLAEISGTSATIYAVIPITLHTNPATNMEYINGVDFNYSEKVRANTIFGVWADSSIQVNCGTETIKSYATSTETPLNHTFSVSSQNNYNVAVAFKVKVKVPIAQATTKVVVFGDSWTDIVNTTYTRWPVLVNALNEFDVTSYGVTGSAISSHVANQVNNFLTVSTTADVFIMMGGINDYRGGTAYTSIVTAVQGYYGQLHEAYPNARFIYLANNQLFYSQDQLKYFNKIIAELRRAGIECYTMYGWVYPNQYSTNDLLHVGNAGNKLIANNILSLLRGGTIATVLNFVNYTYVENGVTIGKFDVFEEWYDGLPKITIQGIASSTLAGKTFTKTLSASTLYLGVSASYVVYPIQRNDRSKYITVYTPISETLDSNKQITTFELTFVANSAGATYVTEGCPRWYA